jgi:hypothetical protein
VAIDGALQEPSVDYTVSSGNITFTDPLANGAKAVVIAPTNTLQVGQLTPSDGSVTSSKLAPNLTLTNPTINNGVLSGCTGYTFLSLAGIQRAIRTVDLVRAVGSTPTLAAQIDPVLTLPLLTGNIYRIKLFAQLVGAGGAQASAGIGGVNSEFGMLLLKRSGGTIVNNILVSANPYSVIGIANTVANQNQTIEVDMILKPLVNGTTNFNWNAFASTGTVTCLAGSYIETEIIG